MNDSNSNIVFSQSNSQNVQNDIRKFRHDLNNILNNILNGLELINDNLDSKSKTTQLLNKVKLNALLASDIINEIPNKNNLNSIKQEIKLYAIIDETIDQFSFGNNKGMIINFKKNSKNDLVWGNYIDIKRILINLINNAKEAKSDVSILIHLNEFSENQIELILEDDGPGIKSELIEFIFTEGFSTKQRGENKGLGLAIVKEIVEEYNGTITVDSIIGKGTSFKIIFPLYKKEKPKKIFTNKTIIIGEDDLFQREVLKDLLCSLNIKALSAANGEEVLKLLRNIIPDLLIIDKTMPIMGGLECIQIINQMKLNIPIVLTSGSNIENFTSDFNITEILKKPYNFDMIQQILERLL